MSQGHPSALLRYSQSLQEPAQQTHPTCSEPLLQLLSDTEEVPLSFPPLCSPRKHSAAFKPPRSDLQENAGRTENGAPAKKGPHTLCPGEFAEKTKGGHSNLWLQFQMDPRFPDSHLSPPLWGGRKPQSRFLDVKCSVKAGR